MRESPGEGKPGPPSCQSATRVLFSVVDLVSADLEEVAQKCGLSYKALVALRRVLLAQFSAFPFNGADLYEELKTSTAILSTGIERKISPELTAASPPLFAEEGWP
uniref:RAD51 paralog D n=1 Tax=Equus asinus TaxID=9793 RepID=A0A9L0IR55_EQUAS